MAMPPLNSNQQRVRQHRLRLQHEPASCGSNAETPGCRIERNHDPRQPLDRADLYSTDDIMLMSTDVHDVKTWHGGNVALSFLQLNQAPNSSS
jgi:hypothetical protein